MTKDETATLSLILDKLIALRDKTKDANAKRLLNRANEILMPLFSLSGEG